ncbi:MAG: ArnT family glycosyltransferase [Candidatus Sulfotelmatobacter sp.]
MTADLQSRRSLVSGNEIETSSKYAGRSVLDDGVRRYRLERWLRYGCYAALLLAIAFFAWVRFHLRNTPLERDEGEYAYVGQLMLHGIPPYKLASNMKLPGTYAAYAVMMAIFGESTAAIHTGMILVNAAAILLIFLLGKYLYGLLAGSVAGITYAFLSIRPALLGIDGHATHFVVLAALAGILVLLYAIDRGRATLFFAAGLCFGTAFLMKQPGIFFAGFGALYWLWQEWKRPLVWRNLLVRGGALAIGTALPYALTCVWLWRAGVFHNFRFWTWSYALQYGALADWPTARHLLSLVFPWVIRPLALWEIGVVGFTAPLWSKYARSHGGFMAGLFFFSCLAVCPGFYFRPHYFILILPAAALCTGVGVEAVRRLLQERRRLAMVAWLPVLYFAVVFVMSVESQYRVYFRLDPIALSRKMHYRQPYVEAVEVADYIKAHGEPGDEIGIIGSEPQICFLTHLHCATSYLYMYSLLEKQRFASQMRADMMQQLERARPRFLLYEDVDLAWTWGPTLAENRPFLDSTWQYAHNGYSLVYQVPVAGVNGYPEHLFGDRGCLYVFERSGG